MDRGNRGFRLVKVIKFRKFLPHSTVTSYQGPAISSFFNVPILPNLISDPKERYCNILSLVFSNLECLPSRLNILFPFVLDDCLDISTVIPTNTYEHSFDVRKLAVYHSNLFF